MKIQTRYGTLLTASLVLAQQISATQLTATATDLHRCGTSGDTLAQFPAVPMLMLTDPPAKLTWDSLAKDLINSPDNVAGNVEHAAIILAKLDSSDIKRIACLHRLAMTLPRDGGTAVQNAAENLLSYCINSIESLAPKETMYLANCYYNLGAILLKQQKFAEAKTNFQKALWLSSPNTQSDPSASADASYCIAVCLADLADRTEPQTITALSEAAKAYEQLTARPPNANTTSASRIAMISLAEDALNNAAKLAMQTGDWSRTEELSKRGLALVEERNYISDPYRPGLYLSLALALKHKNDRRGAAENARNGLAFFGLDPAHPILRSDPFSSSDKQSANVLQSKMTSGSAIPTCATCLALNLSLGTERTTYDKTKTPPPGKEPIPPPFFAVFPRRLDIPTSASTKESKESAEKRQQTLDNRVLVPLDPSSTDSLLPSRSPIHELTDTMIAQRDSFSAGSGEVSSSNDSKVTETTVSNHDLLDALFSRIEIRPQNITGLQRCDLKQLIQLYLDSTGETDSSESAKQLALLAHLLSRADTTTNLMHAHSLAPGKLPISFVSNDQKQLLHKLELMMDIHTDEKRNALIERGSTYKECGDLVKAVQCFTEASEAKPEDKATTSMVVDTWRHAAQTAPNSWQNHAGLSQSYSKLGDEGLAAAENKIALILNPEGKSAEQSTQKLSPVLDESIASRGEDIDFGPYMGSLQHQIKKFWSPAKENESKRTSVIFKISKTGAMSDLHVGKSSGSEEVDMAGLRAVENAAPFRPLPAGSPDTVSIEFTFDFHIETKQQQLDSGNAGTRNHQFRAFLAPTVKREQQDSKLDPLFSLPSHTEPTEHRTDLSLPPIPSALNLSQE